MGALGNIINGAVDSALGKSSGTNLQDFLSHFSSSEGIWIKQIDPLATFDVSIKFRPYPGMDDAATKSEKDWLKDLGNNLLNSAKGAVKNLANNATGGLLGSIMNDVDVMKKHDEFGEKKESTFLEYLAAANLLVGKDDWIGENAGQAVSPLELQLGFYCQEITVPGMEVPMGQMSQTVIGEFPINGTFVKTDSQILTMKLLNTKVPLMERIFVPWMREITTPWWNYNSQPYTTATITIDFTKHSNLKYVFVGCRPQQIETLKAEQQASFQNLTRNMTMVFDAMFVNSDLKTCESLEDKLLSTGRTLFNGAANMMNA